MPPPPAAQPLATLTSLAATPPSRGFTDVQMPGTLRPGWKRRPAVGAPIPSVGAREHAKPVGTFVAPKDSVAGHGASGSLSLANVDQAGRDEAEDEGCQPMTPFAECVDLYARRARRQGKGVRPARLPSECRGLRDVAKDVVIRSYSHPILDTTFEGNSKPRNITAHSSLDWGDMFSQAFGYSVYKGAQIPDHSILDGEY